MRWHMIFRQGAQNHKIGNGRPLRPGSESGELGRDAVFLGLCWEDREQEGRQKVEEAVGRQR